MIWLKGTSENFQKKKTINSKIFFFPLLSSRYQMVGSEPINHRIFSFHKKFSLNKMTGWRFKPPTFGTESLQIEP